MTIQEWVDSIAGSQGYSWKAGNAITQWFNTPVSYIAGRRIHGGYDIRGKLGTPIRAWKSGKVVYSKLNGGWGELVIVRTPDGLNFWYCHLNRRAVLVGLQVAAGQEIGTLGTTGYSTGPHLHFECRDDAGKLIDPATISPDTPMAFTPSKEQQDAFSDMLGIGVYTKETPKNQDRYEQAVILKRVFRVGDKRWLRLDGANKPA